MDTNLSRRLQHMSSFYWVGFVLLSPSASEAISILTTHTSPFTSLRYSFVTFNKIWTPFLATFFIGWVFWIMSLNQFLYVFRSQADVLARQFPLFRKIFIGVCTSVVAICSLLFAFLTVSPLVYSLAARIPVVFY